MMNKDFKVTIDGRPAYATMVKYRLENEFKRLGQNIVEGMKPRIDKIDEYFMAH